jgi:ABC-type branched-subunit amino acid transport system ATPase component
MGLATEENLKIGRGDISAAVALFPELRSLWRVKAGLLSGGEQQMLTLARALGRAPRLLLADELSLGPALLVVDRMLRAVRQAADAGLGVLLVEQHVRKVLGFADRVLRRGRVVLQGATAELKASLQEIESTYLSAGGPPEAAMDIDE